MPEFVAITSKGLQEELEKELKELGFEHIEKQSGGVKFTSNWAGCYRANLASRLANRILKPVLEFTAYDGEELYHNIMKHDFTKYIKVNQTLKVDATTKESKMHDQRFIAMKVKDAIVDQFREKYDARPDVDTERASLPVFVRAYKNKFFVAIDTSGDPLFKRGYRRGTGIAPLKETLAAGLIRLSEWDQKTPLFDPMCGSGTLLIEAALLACRIAPGTLRSHFAFQNFLGFDAEVFAEELDKATDQEITDEVQLRLYGADVDRQVLKDAQQNAMRAGVDHLIEFKKGDVVAMKRPGENITRGMIVTNPPYGARMGDEDNLKDVYRDLAFSLKSEFNGWDAWILAGSPMLTAELKLKANRRHFVFNGLIECRFLRYPITGRNH